jgi:hypothetical protein
LEFLEDYHGYIQSDDFAGYDHPSVAKDFRFLL